MNRPSRVFSPRLVTEYRSSLHLEGQKHPSASLLSAFYSQGGERMGTPGIDYSVAFSLVMNGITELMHRPNLYNWEYAEHPICIRCVNLFQILKDGRPNPALIFTVSQLCEACGYDLQSYNGGSMQYSQRHRQNVNEWLLRLSKERCFIYYKKLNPITKNQETEVSYGKAAPISVRYLRDGKVSWKRPPRAGREVRCEPG